MVAFWVTPTRPSYVYALNVDGAGDLGGVVVDPGAVAAVKADDVVDLHPGKDGASILIF